MYWPDGQTHVFEALRVNPVRHPSQTVAEVQLEQPVGHGTQSYVEFR